ncbi:thermonuclease family protein [Orrella sp. JC864]|uniref:thermonuclease family protein n=1 Tax=Orrella sp. JC864 TaxID=3120298 RepID=UPI00300BE70C
MRGWPRNTVPRRWRPRGWQGLAAAALAALAVQLWPQLQGYLGGREPQPGPPDGQPYVLSGTVTAVADGDTVTLSVGQARHRIRLASIDAPEIGDGRERPGQPYAQAARRGLQALVGNATVQARCYERDQYERDICDLILPDGVNVNQALVAQGLAWANRQGRDRHLRDRGLIGLEQQARQARRGLWAEPAPVQPWVWRHRCWRERQC